MSIYSSIGILCWNRNIADAIQIWIATNKTAIPQDPHQFIQLLNRKLQIDSR